MVREWHQVSCHGGKGTKTLTDALVRKLNAACDERLAETGGKCLAECIGIGWCKWCWDKVRKGS